MVTRSLGSWHRSSKGRVHSLYFSVWAFFAIQRFGAGNCTESKMLPPAIFALMIFLAGAAFGYALRAVISRRRHIKARHRYKATGSYRRP